MPPAWRSRSPFFAAVLLVLPGFAWTLDAGWRSTFAAFGRDTGIFQYVAWALTQGERAYVQVRDINGPLVPAIHLVFLKLGGADEHVFRSLCFALFSAAALLVGALLPGIGRRKGEEPLPFPWATRVAWALAAWVVLGAGYLIYGWWEHGQREDFFDDLLLPALALQVRAQLPGTPPRVRRWLLVGAGGLGALTWFGKPSCLLYSAGQAAALLLDDEMEGPRRSR